MLDNGETLAERPSPRLPCDEAEIEMRGLGSGKAPLMKRAAGVGGEVCSRKSGVRVEGLPLAFPGGYLGRKAGCAQSPRTRHLSPIPQDGLESSPELGAGDVSVEG